MEGRKRRGKERERKVKEGKRRGTGRGGDKGGIKEEEGGEGKRHGEGKGRNDPPTLQCWQICKILRHSPDHTF